MSDIINYIRAGYSSIYMVTPEESRAELLIATTVAQLNAAAKDKDKHRRLIVWSHTDGFQLPDGKSTEQIMDPVAALKKIRAEPGPAIFVFRDLHSFFGMPAVLRLLRDISREFKQQAKTLFIISPVSKITPEIERDITLVDFTLPTREEINKVWDILYTANKARIDKLTGFNEDERELIIQSAMGLTSAEAEAAFAKALVVNRYWPEGQGVPPAISKLVLKEKAQAVKKQGILEYFETDTNTNDVGGLAFLKKWLTIRKKAYSKKARERGIPTPRGIALVGLPGCGKSLSAKAASNIFGVPLIRFDIGRVFGGIVGASEQNVRNATQTIDAIGNCVVWIDEADKAFSGAGGGGGGDNGVTDRVFGHILTWAQEKKSSAFIMMTINRIDNILARNPELLRKGRFDEIFFVGLPSIEERKQILDIHIRRLSRDGDAKKLKIDLDELAEHSVGFSGAELEEAVISALYIALDRDDALKTDYIGSSILNTNPLSRSAATQLKHMAEWAQINAIDASVGKEVKDDAKGRSLEIE
jgi:SpoVK/Ycf46/Vps4 family AAA+-type ATPase